MSILHAYSYRVGNCVRGEGVQGVLTLICGGAAQTCHDDRVVELKEQLEVEEVDGEGQEGKVKEDNVIAQNLSQEVCGVIIKCGTVRAMCELNA